jgi:hypothetical protein
MRTLRVALVAAVLAVGAVACGGDPTAEINQTFKGYYTALLARDFPTACGYAAPESTQRLLSTLATQGIKASTCEEAFSAVYDEPGAADVSDTIARTAKINDIQVDGDQATVKWTSTVDGQSQDGTYGMQRIDGRWKFVVVAG